MLASHYTRIQQEKLPLDPVERSLGWRRRAGFARSEIVKSEPMNTVWVNIREATRGANSRMLGAATLGVRIRSRY
jgi:hypothetical protein